MADWPGHCVVPLTPNHNLAPLLEWKVDDKGEVVTFRLRDGFGTLIFSVSVAWPWGPTMTLDAAGQLAKREND
jgi:hypothetical protein